MALQAAYKKVITEGSRQAGKQRDIKRLSAVNLEGVYVLGVVAVEERTANRRSKPVIALAK